MTPGLLEKIYKVVKLDKERQLATWVTMLGGFFMVLRKSNLVPLSRVYDMVHNITRRDVRYHAGVMVVVIRWSKTDQFGQNPDKILMVADKNNPLCPVHWILHMVDKIPAKPDNLFSYRNKKGLVPVTYRDLMVQMRQWIQEIGVKNPNRYSSHSLRRGASSMARKKQLTDTQIMRLGNWKSQCFRNYIQEDVGSRVNTWFQLSGMKH